MATVEQLQATSDFKSTQHRRTSLLPCSTSIGSDEVFQKYDKLALNHFLNKLGISFDQ